MPTPSVTRCHRWMQSHPLAPDLLLAVVACVLILIASVTEPQGAGNHPRFGHRNLEPLTVVLTVLGCAAVALRRRMPLPVLAVTSLLTLVQLQHGGHQDQATTPDGRTALVATVVIALYTVAARTDRPTTWRVGAVTVLGLTAAGMLLGARPWYNQENLGIFAWTALAAAVGDAVRSRRAFVDAIRERAERAERTREEEARRRVAEERMRIARELHDVVAHHIALVNVQAGVVSHVMDRRPDQARVALAHIREASRHALDELQTTVGLLRQTGEPEAPTEPAPGLAVLDELVDGFRRAGLAVQVEASASMPVAPGTPRFVSEASRVPDVVGTLPSAVDLAAYRVVQEALTNVQKHAGTGARAQVRLMRDPDTLRVIVTDDGGLPDGDGPDDGPEKTPDGPPRRRAGGGHGLVGMRERATALGGSCTAAPRSRGFAVRVLLPLPTSRPAPIGPDAAPEAGPAAPVPGSWSAAASGANESTGATCGRRAAPVPEHRASEATEEESAP